MLPSRFAQPTPIFTQRVRVFRSSLGSGYSTIARTLSRFVVPFVSLIVRSCPGARRARRAQREEQLHVLRGGDGARSNHRPGSLSMEIEYSGDHIAIGFIGQYLLDFLAAAP